MPLKCWSIDCIDSQCPLGITFLLTMRHHGGTGQALKGFPGLYFSLSLFPLNALKSDLKWVSREKGGTRLCPCPALWQGTRSQLCLGLGPPAMLIPSSQLHHTCSGWDGKRVVVVRDKRKAKVCRGRHDAEETGFSLNSCDFFPPLCVLALVFC